MSHLSTAQVRTLELVVGATSRGAPFIPPSGPRGRPAKFLKSAELVEERNGVGGQLWATARGIEELERVKGRAP